MFEYNNLWANISFLINIVNLIGENFKNILHLNNIFIFIVFGCPCYYIREVYLTRLVYY